MGNKSANFNGKIFLNPVRTDVMNNGAFFRVLREYFQKHPHTDPVQAFRQFKTVLPLLNTLPDNCVRATWLGHSSTLIEIDGKRFLTDPLWYERASPFRHVGPKRFFPNPIEIKDLPKIDYILLSHDHYDHLDKKAILFLAGKKIPVITMLGVGQRLIDWGVPKKQVTSLDWWENISLSDNFTVTAAPARHFSGRCLNDRFKTLWGSFAIRGPKYNVYFGGDSGYYKGFAEIGERLGPFDLTMLEIGAYNKEWKVIHMEPEAAIQAHIDLRGGLLLPIHWGTFNLAFHSWKEPVERLIKEAERKKIPLLLPQPGQTLSIHQGAYNSKWWESYL